MIGPSALGLGHTRTLSEALVIDKAVTTSIFTGPVVIGE